MSKAIYIDKEENRYEVEVDNGLNLMQAAVDNMVPNILGDCGGFCACATCHVHVDPDWFEKTGSASETEQDLLEGVEEMDQYSRLCCQIIMSDELDGIVLHLPESQL